MKRIQYGMVGGALSAFIGDVHRKAISFDPRARLAAGCFSTRPAMNAETGEVLGVDASRVYASYEAMAEAEAARPDGIDFVSIVTPNNMHYAVAKCFLTHGIHVMCEKPLCFTLEEARELRALAAERGLLFGVCYSYSGYTMVKVMREMIAAGKIGEVATVNAEYPQEWLIDDLGESDPGTAKLSGWRSDPQVAGASNCVGDIGTHIEHTVHYLTGLRIKRLLATANTFGQALDLNANMIVEYETGVNGAYWCSQIAAGKLNGLCVRIYGSLGSLEWEQHTPDYVRFTPKGRPPEILSRATGYLDSPAAAYSRIPSGHPEGLYVAFANVYKGFITAVELAKQGDLESARAQDFPDVEDGVRGVAFIQAVMESAKQDAKWIKVDA